MPSLLSPHTLLPLSWVPLAQPGLVSASSTDRAGAGTLLVCAGLTSQSLHTALAAHITPDQAPGAGGAGYVGTLPGLCRAAGLGRWLVTSCVV